MSSLNFSWVVPGILAGSARPNSKTDVLCLQQSGVCHVVSLTEVKPTLHGVTLRQTHIPIPDFTSPTRQQVELFLSLAEEAQASGQALVVHCAHGKGRAGTMLACFIAKSIGCTGEEAIAKIRYLRPGSVETREQEEFIRQYAASLRT